MQHYRQPAGPHVPAVDISHPRDFAAYEKGLRDGEMGRAFDPLWSYQPKEKDIYRAGFTRAREEPRIPH